MRRWGDAVRYWRRRVALKWPFRRHHFNRNATRFYCSTIAAGGIFLAAVAVVRQPPYVLVAYVSLGVTLIFSVGDSFLDRLVKDDDWEAYLDAQIARVSRFMRIAEPKDPAQKMPDDKTGPESQNDERSEP